MVAKPEPTGEVVSNVMWHYRGINVNTWLTGDVARDSLRMLGTFQALKRFLEELPSDAREEVLKEQQRGGGGYGGGRGGGRADRFPVIDGYQCDKCHGPVGRKAKQGGMRTDAVVCLGSCKEEGKDGKQFTYTVGWCNDDGTPGPKVPKAQGGVVSAGNAPAGERPASPTTPKERTVGDLLNWALKEHGLNSTQVCQIVGVSGAADIKDINAATKQVLAHVNGAPVA